MIILLLVKEARYFVRWLFFKFFLPPFTVSPVSIVLVVFTQWANTLSKHCLNVKNSLFFRYLLLSLSLHFSLEITEMTISSEKIQAKCWKNIRGKKACKTCHSPWIVSGDIKKIDSRRECLVCSVPIWSFTTSFGYFFQWKMLFCFYSMLQNISKGKFLTFRWFNASGAQFIAKKFTWNFCHNTRVFD